MSEEYTSTQFAASMKVQSYDLMPEDLSEENKEYIANTLYEFTKLAFETLENDKKYEYTYNDKTFISQVVAEWTFHKAVDLIKSNIPKEYWDAGLQKFAFTTFETAKEGVNQKIPQQDLLQVIESHVNEDWKIYIEEMYLKGAFDLDTKAKALNQSNIDEYAQQKAEENENIIDKLEETEQNLQKQNQEIDEEIQKDGKEIAQIVEKNRGCANVMQFFVYISAAIMTGLFVFLLKKFHIDTNILRQIKHLSFYIGIFTSFVFGVCNLIQHFKNSFSLKAFGKINEICKNILFYTCCGLLSVMCITGFKPLSCIIAAIIFIKFSAIATVNQVKCKNIN